MNKKKSIMNILLGIGITGAMGSLCYWGSGGGSFIFWFVIIYFGIYLIIFTIAEINDHKNKKSK